MLASDRVEPALDEAGRVITRWNGKTFKPHPVTGAQVPDDAARVAQWAYVNPRQAEWPTVEFNLQTLEALGRARAEAVAAGTV